MREKKRERGREASAATVAEAEAAAYISPLVRHVGRGSQTPCLQKIHPSGL